MAKRVRNIGMTEAIKVLMVRCGTNQKELATKLGITQPTLSKKFKLDDWRESDLKEIAKICGCSYEGTFKLNNGEIIKQLYWNRKLQ